MMGWKHSAYFIDSDDAVFQDKKNQHVISFNFKDNSWNTLLTLGEYKGNSYAIIDYLNSIMSSPP